MRSIGNKVASHAVDALIFGHIMGDQNLAAVFKLNNMQDQFTLAMRDRERLIDTTQDNGTLVAEIPVDVKPKILRLSPNGDRLLVSNFNSGTTLPSGSPKWLIKIIFALLSIKY